MTELEYKISRIKLALEYRFGIQIGVTVGDKDIFFFHNTSLRGDDGGEINNKIAISMPVLENCKTDCIAGLEQSAIKQFRERAVEIYCEIMRNED